jgi:hypothetical protein
LTEHLKVIRNYLVAIEGKRNGETEKTSWCDQKGRCKVHKDERIEKTKRSAKSAKRRTKTLPRKVGRGSTTRKARPRKQRQVSAPAPQVETAILDIIEEPVPGMVTVTEIETVRLRVPDSDEDSKAGDLPPEEGMAA